MRRLGGTTYSKKHEQTMLAMGAWLRKTRIHRGHTQRDVALAIGKSIQYVSEVEHGKRGHKMGAVCALQWCEYLNLDSERIFGYLGLGATSLERWRVRHFLETSAWASKYMRALRTLKRARTEMRELRGGLRFNSRERDVAKSIADRLDEAITCLHVPRNDGQEVVSEEVSHAEQGS